MMRVCWLVGSFVCSFVRDAYWDFSKKSDFHEIWQCLVSVPSLLTFERSRSKFKVKTAVLKIVHYLNISAVL